MLKWLDRTSQAEPESVIGVAVLMFFLGLMVATKMRNRWGWLFVAAGLLLALFALRRNGIPEIFF